METVIRNVAEIDSADRQAIEHLIGKRLTEHQRVIISVVNAAPAHPVDSVHNASVEVPDWWNVYEGLNDDEIDRLDQAIRPRANITRAFGLV